MLARWCKNILYTSLCFRHILKHVPLTNRVPEFIRKVVQSVELVSTELGLPHSRRWIAVSNPTATVLKNLDKKWPYGRQIGTDDTNRGLNICPDVQASNRPQRIEWVALKDKWHLHYACKGRERMTWKILTQATFRRTGSWIFHTCGKGRVRMIRSVSMLKAQPRGKKKAGWGTFHY